MTPEQRKLLSDPELTSGWPQEYELALAAALEDSRRLDVAEDLIRMALNRIAGPNSYYGEHSNNPVPRALRNFLAGSDA